ncbi:uncharacterized protein LOC119455210 [Dermacentor silvarum]|uniref:uncharacterized protein LOC119455210 n=1 Tax=Dermacentor silvarum TaxID=543639 RepID=UPI002100D44A|nr:uncharacterized protein LOC119455210 [Dermacentor silvarum]
MQCFLTLKARMAVDAALEYRFTDTVKRWRTRARKLPCMIQTQKRTTVLQKHEWANTTEVPRGTRAASSRPLVLLENVPPLAGSTDVRLMRTHLLSIVNETRLTPLTCEVLRSPVVSMPNLKEATDRAVSYNPIYPLLEDEEKEDLIRSTADILAGRAEGIAEGKVSGDRFTYVIHAYKPAQ